MDGTVNVRCVWGLLTNSNRVYDENGKLRKKTLGERQKSGQFSTAPSSAGLFIMRNQRSHYNTINTPNYVPQQ
jgi:hypothetical protein